MRVDGSNSEKNAEVVARLQNYSRNQSLKKSAATDKSTETPQPATTTSESTSAVTVAPLDSDSSTRAEGALRKLNEGGFKGVPTLRLSINFAEELKGIDATRSQEALQSGVSSLQNELDGAVESFLAENDLTPEELETLESAREEFNNTVAGLLGEEGSAIAIGGSDIFGELRTAFQDFLNSLVPPQEESDSEGVIPIDVSQDAAPEGTEEVPAATVDTTTPVETVTTGTEADTSGATDVFAGLRESLSGIFDNTINSLEETVAAIGRPPIPEPEGNGRAYEKFLASYNEIFGVGTGSDTSTSDEQTLNAVT